MQVERNWNWNKITENGKRGSKSRSWQAEGLPWILPWNPSQLLLLSIWEMLCMVSILSLGTLNFEVPQFWPWHALPHVLGEIDAESGGDHSWQLISHRKATGKSKMKLTRNRVKITHCDIPYCCGLPVVEGPLSPFTFPFEMRHPWQCTDLQPWVFSFNKISGEKKTSPLLNPDNSCTKIS